MWLIKLWDQLASIDLPFDGRAFYDIKFGALNTQLPPCHTKTTTRIQASHCRKAEKLVKEIVVFFSSPFTWGSILHVSFCASIDCHPFSIREGGEWKSCDRSLFFFFLFIKQQTPSIFQWRLNLVEARQSLTGDTQVARYNPLPWQSGHSITYRHKPDIPCVWNMWSCQV